MTETEAPTEQPPRRVTGPVRRPLSASFWRLWAAHGLSNLADSVGFIGVGLLALTLTNDERLLAVTTASIFAAWIVLALPAGVVIDRFDRQRLMVGANLARVAVFGALALLATNDLLSIWSLLGLVAVGGAAEVVFDSTGQAVTPMVVAPDRVARANGLFFTAELVAGSIIGLAFGAVLFDWGVGIPFATMAVAYAVGAALILLVKFRYVPPVDLTAASDTSMWSSVRWLWQNDLLRSVAALSAISSVSYMLSAGIVAKFAVVELGLSSVEFGLLIAINAVGAAAGGLAGARILDALGSRRAMLLSYLVEAACLIAIGVLEPVWAIAAVYAVAGFMIMVWNVATLTLRHEHIAAEQFGRVNGVFRWLLGVTNVVGIIVGGFVAHAASLTVPFILGGVLMLLFGAGAIVPLRRAFADLH